MRPNLVIDVRLMTRAMRVTRLKTKRAVVEAGLEMLIHVKSQSGLRDLRGQVQWEGNLNGLTTPHTDMY